MYSKCSVKLLCMGLCVSVPTRMYIGVLGPPVKCHSYYGSPSKTYKTQTAADERAEDPSRAHCGSTVLTGRGFIGLIHRASTHGNVNS